MSAIAHNPSDPLCLDWCSHEAAKYAVLHWHYSKRMPVGKLVKIGVWEGGNFIGAIIFSCGSGGVGSIGKSFGFRNEFVCELQRVALREHRTPVSRIVSIGIRMLKRYCPKLRLIVSYADPARGHIGAIYQAGNWIYVGKSSATPVWIDKTGKKIHDRSMAGESGFTTHFGHTVKSMKKSECIKIEMPSKYKYFYPLDDGMRQFIEPLRKPYPSASQAKISLRQRIHSGEGGAIPTATLQSSR